MSLIPKFEWKWWEKLWPWSRYYRVKRHIATLPKTKWVLPMVKVRYSKLNIGNDEYGITEEVVDERFRRNTRSDVPDPPLNS